MKEINDVLKERGSNYGSFHTFSNLSQSLYAILLKHHHDINRQNGTENQLPAFMAESLRMICHKLARIANGNPYYADSWVDIGGYSKLVSNILEANEANEAAKAAQDRMQTTQTEETTPVSVPELVKGDS